jgi:hypothetical protein
MEWNDPCCLAFRLLWICVSYIGRQQEQFYYSLLLNRSFIGMKLARLKLCIEPFVYMCASY